MQYRVARIVEPARVDIEVTSGVRLVTRMQFVFRDAALDPDQSLNAH